MIPLTVRAARAVLRRFNQVSTVCVCALLPVLGAHAQTTPMQKFSGPESEWSFLQRLQQASEKISYTGTVVVQTGGGVQTARITHVADANGQHERLEPLDGHPREFIRLNDIVQCLLPDRKLVRMERMWPPSKMQSLMSTSPSELAQLYKIKQVEDARVAGLDCTMYELEPKDSLRYAHRLCLEKDSGLLVKSQTLDDQRDIVDQMAYSELKIGPLPDKLKPRFKPTPEGWKVEDLQTAAAQLSVAGWYLKAPIAGFKKIQEIKKQRPNGPEMGQIVYSDGLTSVSVFIEPFNPERSMPAPMMRNGGVRSQSKRVGDWNVVVLGEVPSQTIRQFANSIDYKKSP